MPTQDYQSVIAEQQYRKAKARKLKKLDPAVFRVGDRVKIVNPYKFVRCGYPYNKDYAIKNLITVEEKHSVAQLLGFKGTLDMFKECLSIKDPYNLYGNKECPFTGFFPEGIRQNNSYYEILDRLAFYKLTECGFGGNMRTIIDERDESLLEGKYIVSSKKVVQTGTRTAGGGNYEDYDPPYLSNMKAHVILCVYKSSSCFETDFEIEAKNCQKIIDSK